MMIILLVLSLILKKTICDIFDVDFSTALNETNFEEGDESSMYNTVSVAIAAAVLSYSRIHMGKIKLYILNNKGNIYI